jgi:hypothetical protein
MEWELAEETEALGETLPQCHAVYHKYHTTWPEIDEITYTDTQRSQEIPWAAVTVMSLF